MVGYSQLVVEPPHQCGKEGPISATSAAISFAMAYRIDIPWEDQVGLEEELLPLPYSGLDLLGEAGLDLQGLQSTVQVLVGVVDFRPDLFPSSPVGLVNDPFQKGRNPQVGLSRV